MFSVRIVKVDHYIAPPIRGLDVCYSEFRNCQITKVPVIRIFGPTPAGQKVCVHLHGTFPYIYIPYDGTEPADRYMRQLASKLDQSLSTNQAGTDSGGVQWVHKIELVSGIPFYGYHAKEHQFLKIYFLSPQIIERALELLQSGAIMNHSFQPHEAHIPYILQVFIDYNLYGMNLIKFQNIKFRRKSDTITSKGSLNSSLMGSLTDSPNGSCKMWDPDNLPSAYASDDSVIKQSMCELEVDVLDVDVINSLDFAGSDMNPGIAAIWEDEKQRRRQMGQLSQITPPCSQDRQPTVGTRSEVEYLEKVKQKLCLVTDSQEMSFILDESQVHEKSGVEAKSQNDSVTTCVENSLEETSVVGCSQTSNKDSILDDNDFRELLLDLLDSETEHLDHYSHIHSPTSPQQAIKDDDENDEIIMSQVVQSDALDEFQSPSPSIIQGASRLPLNDSIPQVDGPNDPKDKCEGSPNSVGSHKMSTMRTRTSPRNILDNFKGVLNQGNIEPVLAEKILMEEEEKYQCLTSGSPSMVEIVDLSPSPIPKQGNESKGADSENELQSADTKTQDAAENAVSADRAVKQPSRLSLRSHVKFQRTCVANRELMRSLPIRKSLRQIVSGKVCNTEANDCGKTDVENTSQNRTVPKNIDAISAHNQSEISVEIASNETSPKRRTSRLSLRSGRNLSAQCKVLDSARSTNTEIESLVKNNFNENVVLISDDEGSSCEILHSSKQSNFSQRSRGRGRFRGRPRGRGSMAKDFKNVVDKKDDQQNCDVIIIQDETTCTVTATNFTETCEVLDGASSTDTEKVSLVKSNSNESTENTQQIFRHVQPDVRDNEDSSCESHQSSTQRSSNQSSRGRGRGHTGMDLKNVVDKKDNQQNDATCTATATSVTKTWYRGRRGRGRGRGRSRRTNPALDQRSAKDFQETFNKDDVVENPLEDCNLPFQSEQEEMYLVIVEEIPTQATSNVSEFAVTRSTERSDQGRWSNTSAKNGEVPEQPVQAAMLDMPKPGGNVPLSYMPNLSDSSDVPNLVKTSLLSEMPILEEHSPLAEMPILKEPSPLAEMPIQAECSPLPEILIRANSSPIAEIPNLEKPPLLTKMAIQAIPSPLAEMPNLQEPSSIIEGSVPSKTQPAASEPCALKESFSLEEPSTLKQMQILTKESNEITFSKKKEMLGEDKPDFQVPIVHPAKRPGRRGRPRLRRQICVRNVKVNVDSSVGLRELRQLGFESLRIGKCQSSKVSNETDCLDVSSNSSIDRTFEKDMTEKLNETGTIKNTAFGASLNVQLHEDKTSEDLQPQVTSLLKDKQVEELDQPCKTYEDNVSDAETVVIDGEFDVKIEEDEVVLTDDTEIYELPQTSRRIILKVSKVSKDNFGDDNHFGSRTSERVTKDSLWKCKIVGQTEDGNFISGDDSDESLQFTPRERKCHPIIESSYTEESQGSVSSSTENDLKRPAKRQRKWRRIVKDSSSRSDSDASWNSKKAKSKSRCKKKQQRRRIVSSDSEDGEDSCSEVSSSARRVRQQRNNSYCENGKLEGFIVDTSESESSSVKVIRNRRRTRSCRKSSYCEDSDYELQDAYDDTFAAFGRKNYSLRNNFGKIHDLAVEMRPTKRRTGVDYAPNAYASFYDPEAIGVEGWNPTNKSGCIDDFAYKDEPGTSKKKVKDKSLDPIVRLERLDEDTIEKYLLGQIPFPETNQVADVGFVETISASESENFNSRCPSLTRATSSSDDEDHRPVSPCHVSDEASDNVPEDSNTASSSTYVELGNSPTADRFSSIVNAPCQKIQIEKAPQDDGERYAPFEDVLYKLAWLSPIPENEKTVVRAPVLSLLRAHSPTEMQNQNVSATTIINTSAAQPLQPGSAPKQSSSKRQHDNLPLHGSLPEIMPQPTNPGCASQNTRLILRQGLLQKQIRHHHSSNQSVERQSFPHCNATPSSQERFQHPCQQLPHAGAHSYSFNPDILENRQTPTHPSIESGSCDLPDRTTSNSQQQIPHSSSSLPSLSITNSVNSNALQRSQFLDFRMQNTSQPQSQHYQNSAHTSDQSRMQNFISPGASPLHHYTIPPQSIPKPPFTDYSTPNSLQCIQSTIMPSTPSSQGSPLHPFPTQTLQTRNQSVIMPPTQSPQRSNFNEYSTFSSQEQLQSALMPPSSSSRGPGLSGHSTPNLLAQLQSTVMSPSSSSRGPDLSGYSTSNSQAQLQSALMPPPSSPRGPGLSGHSTPNLLAQLQSTIMSPSSSSRGPDLSGYSTPNSQMQIQSTIMPPSSSPRGAGLSGYSTPNLLAQLQSTVMSPSSSSRGPDLSGYSTPNSQAQLQSALMPPPSSPRGPGLSGYFTHHLQAQLQSALMPPPSSPRGAGISGYSVPNSQAQLQSALMPPPSSPRGAGLSGYSALNSQGQLQSNHVMSSAPYPNGTNFSGYSTPNSQERLQTTFMSPPSSRGPRFAECFTPNSQDRYPAPEISQPSSRGNIYSFNPEIMQGMQYPGNMPASLQGQIYHRGIPATSPRGPAYNRSLEQMQRPRFPGCSISNSQYQHAPMSSPSALQMQLSASSAVDFRSQTQQRHYSTGLQHNFQEQFQPQSHQAGTSSNSANASGPAATSVYVKNINTMVSQTIEYYLNGSTNQSTFLNSNATQASQTPQNQNQGMQNYYMDKRAHKPPLLQYSTTYSQNRIDNNNQLNGTQMQGSQRNSFSNSQLALALQQKVAPPLPPLPPPPPQVRSVHEIRNSMDSLGFDQIRNPYLQVLLDKNPVYTAFHRPQNIRIVKRRGPRKTAAAKLIRKMCMAGRILMPDIFFKSHGFTVRLTVRSGRSVYPPVIKPLEVRPKRKRGRPKLNKLRTKVLQHAYPYNDISKIRGRQRSHCKSNMVTRQAAKQEDSPSKVPRGPPKSMPILNSSDKPLVKTFDTPTPNSAFPPARKQTAKRSIGIRRGMASTRGSFPTSSPSTILPPPPPSIRGVFPRGMRRGGGRPPLSSRGNGSDRKQVIESLKVLQNPASINAKDDITRAPRGRGRPPLQRNPTPREPSVLESLALITEKRPEDIADSITLDKARANSDDEINLDLSPLDEIEPEWFEQPSTLFGKPLQSEKMAAMLSLKPEEKDKPGLHEEKDKSGLGEEKDDSGWNEEEDVSGWHEENDTASWQKENPKSGQHEEKDESGWHEEDDVSGWHEENDTSGWHKENPKASLREEKDESGWHEEEDVSGWHEEKDTTSWHKEDPKPSLHKEKDESGWHEEDDVSGWHEEKDTSDWHKEDPKPGLHKDKDESGWQEEDDVSGWHEETDTSGWHDGKNTSGCNKEKPKSSLHKENDESGWHEEEDVSGWHENKDTSGWNEGKDTSGWDEGKDTSGWGEEKETSGWGEEKDTSGCHKKKNSSALPANQTYAAWREKRGLSGWNEKKDPSGLDEKKDPSDCQEKKNDIWDEVLGAAQTASAASLTDEQSNNTATTSSATSRIPYRFRKKPVMPAPSFEAVEMAHKKSDVLTKYKRDFKRIMGERPKLADNEILSSLMDDDDWTISETPRSKFNKNYAVEVTTGISEDRDSIIQSPEPGQSANNEVEDSPISSKFFSPMLSALQFDTTLDEDPLLACGMPSKRYSKQTDGMSCLSDYLDVNEDEPFGKSTFNSYITLGSSPEPADHLNKDDLTSKPTSSSLFGSGMDNFDNYMPETPCGHNSPDMYDNWCEDVRPTQTFADAMSFPVGSPPELTDISDSVVSRNKEEFSQQKPINSLSDSPQDGLGFVAAIAEGINELVNMQKHSLGSSSVAEVDAMKDPAAELLPALSTCHDEINREDHVMLERAVEELETEGADSNTKADVMIEETLNILPAVDSDVIVPYQKAADSIEESSSSQENLIQNNEDETSKSANDDLVRSPDNTSDLSQENSQRLITGDATPDSKLTKGAISDSIDSTPKMALYNENTLAEKTATNTDIADTPVQSFYIYPNSEPSSMISTPVDIIKDDIIMEDMPASKRSVPKTNVLTYYIPPPSPATILSSMSEYKIPETRHPVAHCSNAADVPTKSVQFGGGTIILKLQSKSLSDLPEFDGPLCSTGLNHWCQVIKIAEEAGYTCSNDCRKKMAYMGKPLLHQGLCLEFHPRPPLASEVQKWLDKKVAKVECVEEKKDDGCLIKNATDKDVTKGTIFPTTEISPISYPAVNRTCNMNDERHDIHSPLVPSVVLNHGQKKRRLSFSFEHELSRESKEDPKFCSSPKPDSPECPVITSPRNCRMKRSFSDGDSAEMDCSLEELDMSCSPSSTGPVAKKGKWTSSTPHKPTPPRESCFRTRSPARDSAQGLQGLSLRRQLFLQQMKTNVQTETSQLQGPTPKNTYGFKMSGDVLQETKSNHIYQHITLMSMELHVQTEEDLCPNPKHNSICAIFYHVHHDVPASCDNKLNRQEQQTGIIFVEAPLGQDSKSSFRKHAELIESGVDVLIVQSEFILVQEFVKIMQKHDPDILLGYEIQMLSWGYLCERCATIGIKLCPLLSRVPDDSMNIFRPPQDGLGDTFVLNIVGRIILSVWQVLKSELALYNYTFENLAYHVLHKRIPLFSFRTLTLWYGQSPNTLNRWRTLQHYIIRTKGNIQLLEQLNFIGKTSELARLFGIQFYEVLSRGTQFRVESMLLRQCRKKKYIAVSPSVQQRSMMRSPEYIQLVMEPVSKFHTNPVVVLDFQSLYPSIIIAYNYCFSTCIGRVEDIGQSDAFKFGCTSLKIPSGLLKKFQDRITVSPGGVAFVKSEIRKGILPRMLEEILTSRIMIKTTMKQYANDKPLYSMLDARQLGLKLISNVTYGYTAANFSGRMPCVEVADSVVSKGRETLERAISLIHETARWNAKVVYGDTDSVFVLLEGRSKEQAFAIGKEIEQAVTAQNPKPVKLKLEKVYLPCVLETKKRYVGNMFETPEQIEPVFDAKGIETVRRDGCPAVAKILEKSLRILFKTHDVSQVKAYVQNQFHKILMSRCSLNDYIFTRDYHGKNGYQQSNYAPAFKIARSLVQSDCRAEPRIGERVPYVVTYGSPGAILLDLICHPHEVLLNSSLCLNAKYYINNAICPALDRVFSLLGADVRQWYSTLPRSTNLPLPIENPSHDGNTILHHFTASKCPVCEASAHSGICPNCLSNPQNTLFVLTDRIRQWERRYQQISTVCQGCTGATDKRISCVSLNCPIFFRLGQSSKDLAQAPYLRGLLKKASLNW